MKLPVLIALVTLLFFSCKKGERKDNLPPDSFISVDEINLSGENRLNSTIALNWFGVDPDGFVESYEISIDGGKTWSPTRSEDSTFIFNIAAGTDTVDIDFQVRSIDGDGLKDPSPAQLIIPIKNTPPVARFKGELMPQDSIYSVASLSWDVSDVDGIETIEQIFIKVNEGAWYPLDKSRNFLSLIADDPSRSGSGMARIYFGSKEFETTLIEDFRVNELNQVYIKAVDIAGAESEPDTSSSFFVKGVNSDLLVIAGHPLEKAFFVNNLNLKYPNYDLIDYHKNQGENQPKFWNPGFSLLINLYDKLIIFTENSLFQDAQTKTQQLILEAAAPALQDYLDANGKAWVNAIFPNNFSPNSALFETLPMSSISDASGGYAILPTDSMIIPQFATYDTLKPTRLINRVEPFNLAADAEAMYRGQLEIRAPWYGPDVIAARRMRNGKVVQVFFSLELSNLNGNPTAMSNLFDQVLNTDFNW